MRVSAKLLLERGKGNVRTPIKTCRETANLIAHCGTEGSKGLTVELKGLKGSMWN